MGDQYNCHAADPAQGLPTLLPIFDPILHGQVQRVEKHTDSKLKADTMLALVGEALVLIPCESRFCHKANVTTNMSLFKARPKRSTNGFMWAAHLNKGEAHHALKNALHIGHQGEIRDPTTEGQHLRMAGLNLLAAIIIYWNTKHPSQALHHRKSEGLDYPTNLLAHTSRLGWARRSAGVLWPSCFRLAAA